MRPDCRSAVLVVGLEDGPEAGWGPFVLACLDARRVRRIGAVLHHSESGAFRTDLLDAVHRVPAPEPDLTAFARAIVKIVSRERVRAVIAGSARTTAALARAAAEIRAAGADVCVARPERRARKAAAARGRAPEIAFEAALVCGARARVRSYAAVRVLAADPQGRPWLAVTVADDALLAAAVRAAAARRAEGPLVLRFTEGPRFRAAEIRPGFPMWVEAAHAAGAPLVEDALAWAAGLPAARHAPPVAGVLFSQTAEDLPIDLASPVRLARLVEA